jgi:hypothetical protein
MFVSILHMFRATSCLSEESIVSTSGMCTSDHLVCRPGRKFLPNLHSRRSPTQSDTHQMLYWYNWFSWWWALGCSKHVEKWNKHREERILCVKLVIYKKYTEMIARSTEHKILDQKCYPELFFTGSVKDLIVTIDPHSLMKNLFLVYLSVSTCFGRLWIGMQGGMKFYPAYQTVINTFM